MSITAHNSEWQVEGRLAVEHFTFDHTLSTCHAYADPVHVDGDFVVKDWTHHHGRYIGPDPRLFHAVESPGAQEPRFEINRDSEDYQIAWSPNGFLRRVR